MTVLLDTNAIVAAFAARGLCKDILEYCLKETKIILSDPLLSEIQIAFTRKLKLPPIQIKSILFFLEEYVTIIKPSKLAKPFCRDASDDVVLATAKGGNADVIVGGDKELLVFKNFESVKILSPREFWEWLKKMKRKGKTP